MIRIIDMTEALSQTEFAFSIFDTVRSRFMTDPEADTQTWTLSEWKDPVFCTYDEDFKQRVRNLLPKYPIVVINGEPHYTEIIGGIQHFMGNNIIEDFAEGIDLSEVARYVHEGQYSEEEFREVYRLLRHSLETYRSRFPDDDLDNPLDQKGEENVTIEYQPTLGEKKIVDSIVPTLPPGPVPFQYRKDEPL